MTILLWAIAIFGGALLLLSILWFLAELVWGEWDEEAEAEEVRREAPEDE